MVQVAFNVNGTARSVDVEPRTLLVEALRQNLGMTGTHVGCETSQCGACTVHMDGRPIKSCTILAVQAEGRAIKTIEGVANADGTLHPMQAAFRDNHALQCGFCTPGMVMAALGIVERHKGATLDEQTIRHELEGNICRCTGYQGIVNAITQAHQVMAGGR